MSSLEYFEGVQVTEFCQGIEIQVTWAAYVARMGYKKYIGLHSLDGRGYYIDKEMGGYY